MRLTEGLAVFNGQVDMSDRGIRRHLFRISKDEALSIRKTHNENQGKIKLQHSAELKQLIAEQQKELKLENRPAYCRGLKSNFEKSRKGIFVGNRVPKATFFEKQASIRQNKGWQTQC